ncbi:hypothetical protein SUGI_0709270 [Cryptomeria japonica]|nr:hypothetical protein SUGI_0709270 [Cryptomeria japonica]
MFFLRLLKATKDKRELLEVRQEIEELRSILHVHISVCIFKRICEYEKKCGENEEDLSEGSPKSDKRGIKNGKASGKRSHGEAFTQIEGISKNKESSNKRFHIDGDNQPNTPSLSKANVSQRETIKSSHSRNI